MQRRLSLVSIVLLFTFWLNPVWAELQYWVSVGSYQQSDRAERALMDARDKMAEQFAVVGTQTAKGYYYRVAAGPFVSRQAAEDRVRQARSVGFTGAWLWADQSDVFETGLYSEFSTDTDYSLGDDGASDDFDYEAAPLRVDPDAEDALIKQRSLTPELIEEAPESFQLNKLRRDA